MTIVSSPKRNWAKFSETVSHTEPLDVVCGATLFLLTFFGFHDPFVDYVTKLALLAVLLNPAFLRNPLLWGVLAIVNSVALLDQWVLADNHKYLTVYWLYAVTISASVTDRQRSDELLAWHGRFFLIFVFCIAALQKSLSPTYMSGEMFELRLLLDDRFAALGYAFGLENGVIEGANELVSKLKNPFAHFDGNEILLPATELSRKIALALTWYDILVQILIGLLFVPGRIVTDRIGHYILIFFIWTTYLPAPVLGFGLLLSIYGVSASWKRFPKMRIFYLISMIFVVSFGLPWRSWLF
jgi:hypothetical protein